MAMYQEVIQEKCLACKVADIEYECVPCGCKSFCRRCAMKVASGGKCKNCREFYTSVRKRRDTVREPSPTPDTGGRGAKDEASGSISPVMPGGGGTGIAPAQPQAEAKPKRRSILSFGRSR
uniref:Uncharacterized protein n=1 Tax=Florenciella parvula TaxID=236787 RepID=A0A7S2B7F5_9STRA